MPRGVPQAGVRWERLPLARGLPPAREWLEQEAAAGLAAGTIDAYSRGVERYLAYCRERRISPRRATTEHVGEYLRELAGAGLGQAARLQRLTALRLFYAFVVERGLRPDNPAPSSAALLPDPAGPAGSAARAEGAGPAAPSAAGPGEPLPWIPDEAQWLGVLRAASAERPRSRLMLALAYTAALRREELCALRVADLDPPAQVLRVPAFGSVGARRGSRVVPLSPAVAERSAAYLRQRARAAGGDSEAGGALFLSESPRNRAAPLAVWGWSKVVRGIALRAGVGRFSTSTPRHLRLTDLARGGRSVGEIARFAGQRRPGPARRYLRLAQARPGAAPGAAPAHEGDAGLWRRRDDQLRRVLLAGER